MGHLGGSLRGLGGSLGGLWGVLGRSWGGLGEVLGDLGGSWRQEVGKLALAISPYHPGEAKSVIRMAFLGVPAEQERGSRRLLTEDQGGNSRPKLPREGG